MGQPLAKNGSCGLSQPCRGRRETVSSRFELRSAPRGKRRGERAMHACDVGLDTGEKPECFDRLVHAHPAAVEHAGPLGGSGFDELRFDRRINDVGGPKRRSERRNWYRIAGKAAHAHLCRVDHSLRSRDIPLKFARDSAAGRAIIARNVSVERIRTGGVAVIE